MSLNRNNLKKSFRKKEVHFWNERYKPHYKSQFLFQNFRRQLNGKDPIIHWTVTYTKCGNISEFDNILKKITSINVGQILKLN